MNMAITHKTDWSSSNTTVSFNSNTNCSQVRLHGHLIATVDHSTNAVKLDSCGYETVTTKSRLNALLEEVKYGCKVFQKNWNWYVSYNGQSADFSDGMILIDTASLQIA